MSAENLPEKGIQSEQDYEERVVTSAEDIRALGRAGWEKYDQITVDGVQMHFYRRPKQFGVPKKAEETTKKAEVGSPKKGESNRSWYIAAAIMVIVILVVGVVAYEATLPSTSSTPTPSPTMTPTPASTASMPSTSTTPTPTSTSSATRIDIYAGEPTSSTYGFGLSANSITSPGPTLTFTAGQTVTVTFHNAGTMDHNWAIVDAKSSTANVLWNAKVGSSSNPISVGGTASVTFTVGSAGTYYYICQVDAHVALGMWGTVTVNP
ncbi:MAG TPA: plastocyanin/azurin family copper-binding protein [Candidatus Nanoarchaeia archaeon]|nr:plastocyanin/azurin family copper-binding protein [Candidatus Nanoarchaeia archaeon]